MKKKKEIKKLIVGPMYPVDTIYWNLSLSVKRIMLLIFNGNEKVKMLNTL